MTDYDQAATVTAPERISDVIARAACGVCEKPIYREPLFPGVPTEWRHGSTSRPISWNPEKHLAGLAPVEPHQHRFSGNAAVRACTFSGCDSQLLHRPKPSAQKAVVLTDRETKDRQSRLRGNKAAAQQRRGGSIPF